MWRKKDIIILILAMFFILLIMVSLSYVIVRSNEENEKMVNFAKLCKYGVYSYNPNICRTKEKYCRNECRRMLEDLNDTWGSDTNNNDTVSKTIMDCYKDCVAND